MSFLNTLRVKRAGGSKIDFYFFVVDYYKGECQLAGNGIQDEKLLFLAKVIAFKKNCTREI